MRYEQVKDYDTTCGGQETILTNFLKNHQYGGQGSDFNQSLGNSDHLNDEFNGHKNSGYNFGQGERYYGSNNQSKPYNDSIYGPSSGNQRNGFHNNDQYQSAPW